MFPEFSPKKGLYGCQVLGSKSNTRAYLESQTVKIKIADMTPNLTWLMLAIDNKYICEFADNISELNNALHILIILCTIYYYYYYYYCYYTFYYKERSKSPIPCGKRQTP
jgi:hypothetical protein